MEWKYINLGLVVRVFLAQAACVFAASVLHLGALHAQGGRGVRLSEPAPMPPVVVDSRFEQPSQPARPLQESHFYTRSPDYSVTPSGGVRLRCSYADSTIRRAERESTSGVHNIDVSGAAFVYDFPAFRDVAATDSLNRIRAMGFECPERTWGRSSDMAASAFQSGLENQAAFRRSRNSELWRPGSFGSARRENFDFIIQSNSATGQCDMPSQLPANSQIGRFSQQSKNLRELCNRAVRELEIGATRAPAPGRAALTAAQREQNDLERQCAQNRTPFIARTENSSSGGIRFANPYVCCQYDWSQWLSTFRDVGVVMPPDVPASVRDHSARRRYRPLDVAFRERPGINPNQVCEHVRVTRQQYFQQCKLERGRVRHLNPNEESTVYQSHGARRSGGRTRTDRANYNNAPNSFTAATALACACAQGNSERVQQRFGGYFRDQHYYASCDDQVFLSRIQRPAVESSGLVREGPNGTQAVTMPDEPVRARPRATMTPVQN